MAFSALCRGRNLREDAPDIPLSPQALRAPYIKFVFVESEIADDFRCNARLRPIANRFDVSVRGVELASSASWKLQEERAFHDEVHGRVSSLGPSERRHGVLTCFKKLFVLVLLLIFFGFYL